MRWRASWAVVACGLALACGSHGALAPNDDDASAPHDADTDAGSSDGAFPSPDALVLADDSGADDANATEDTGPPPGSCVGKADGAVCVKAPDACHVDAICKQGLCGGLDTRADGYNWQAGDDTARCCHAKVVHTNTSSDCGACGIACNAVNGESCQLLGGHYFCRGCVASAACWSKCCSLSFSPGSCAASDCAGNCSAQFCPPGTHCVVGGATSSDYCAY
jgi:hypothetical protein